MKLSATFAMLVVAVDAIEMAGRHEGWLLVFDVVAAVIWFSAALIMWFYCEVKYK